MKKEVTGWPRRSAWGLAAVGLITAALLAACGGGADDGEGEVTFVFRLRGASAAEAFRVSTASAAAIQAARAQLRLPPQERHLFPSGILREDHTGQNPPWHWRLVEVSLVESAIELCDARPSMVEADLPYWLGTVQRFCPWGAYVEAEL